MKIKRLIFPIFLMLLVLCSCKPTNNSTSNSKTITVFGDGSAEYSIVYASSASDEELDLAYALGILSGDKAAIYYDGYATMSKEILIGNTNRTVSSEFAKKLNKQSSEIAFQYLIAEKDGKIIIIADSTVGYLFAWERICETYIQDESLIIPSGLCDVQSVTWDEYYLSDIYNDNLAWEEEQKRQEEQLKELEEELNRYEQGASENIMTVGQKIEEYKTLIAGFKTMSFGEYSASNFKDSIAINGYSSPSVYPTEGAHPRVLFTENSIDTIRDNFSATENKAAYTEYMLNSSQL